MCINTNYNIFNFFSRLEEKKKSIVSAHKSCMYKPTWCVEYTSLCPCTVRTLCSLHINIHHKNFCTESKVSRRKDCVFCKPHKWNICTSFSVSLEQYWKITHQNYSFYNSCHKIELNRHKQCLTEIWGDIIIYHQSNLKLNMYGFFGLLEACVLT